MRVILDVSSLGLGHLYAESRGGCYRVHLHLARGLVRSGECEVSFCANCSSVAFQGAADHLAGSPELAGVPLLAPHLARASGVRRAAMRVHRTLRTAFPGHAFPHWLRAGARLVDQRVHPPVRDSAPPADIFHSPGAPLPPPLRGTRGPRRILTVYDAGPARHPTLYDGNHAESARQTLASLTPDDWLIAPSAASRDDLVEYAGVDPARAFVVPLAADPETFYPCTDRERQAALRARLGIPPGPYFLALDALDLRKNLRGAVRAFTRLVRQQGIARLTLVLAGPEPGVSPGVAEALADAPDLAGRVVAVGYVPDADLAALYSGALAFIYPSLYEGFGLPPLEAMQCGTPVIASDTASLPEVLGDAGMLVPPTDEDALCQAMLRVHDDPALRARLSAQSLVRATHFGWDRFTRETLQVYRAVLAG